MEALFAAVDGSHSDDHVTRNDRIKDDKRWNRMWAYYRPLWSLSMKARYMLADGKEFSAHFDVKRIEPDLLSNWLHKIRQFVGNELKTIAQAGEDKPPSQANL
jgi:hypothetical protein